jgi:delta 1-pyrroline-5-carboxylate dehydrogenase
MVLHEITTDGGKCKSEHQTYTVPLILNGKEVKTTTTFDVRNPETNKTIWRSSSASEEHAIGAVESAETAFQTWSQTKPLVRRSILLRAAQLFRERKDELVHYGTAETGLDVEYTDFILNVMDEMLEDVAGKITSIQGFSPTLLEEGRSAIVHREPYGVILGIAPWNAPWPLRLPRSMFCSCYRKYCGSQRIGIIATVLLGHCGRFPQGRFTRWLPQHASTPS